jgi:hypothetical protein
MIANTSRAGCMDDLSIAWSGTALRLGVERYRLREQLMEMDDRQLKDIGITRAEAEQEARKPVWKD